MRWWIPRLEWLGLVRVAGLALAALAPAVVAGPVAAQAPGAECQRPGDVLTRMICASDDLRAVSVAGARAFTALRQQEGRAGERALVLGAAQAQADLLRACGLDVYAPERALDRRDGEMREACILAGFRVQLSGWMARLHGAAREEATRPARELEQGQLDLREIGLLDDRTVLDGVYRTSTRQAIARWQRQAGRPETGLLGDEDAAALRAAAMTPAAPAAAQMTVSPMGEGMLLIVTPVDLATGPGMRFVPDEMEIPALGPGKRRVILAEGAVKPESPDSLTRLLATGWEAGAVILLASEGGNAEAGLALGRLIRRAGLVTMIGRRGFRGVETAGVRCFGACADAFLGGAQRLHAAGALFGVRPLGVVDGMAATVAQAEAAARQARAAHLAYVREMGVDPELEAEAARADARHINVLSPGRMAELGVLTAGGGHAWTVLTVSGQRFLRAHLAEAGGVNTAAFACGPRTARAPLLYVNLRTGDVAQLRRAVAWPLRVMVDGKEVAVDPEEVAGPARVVDETLAFAVRLTPRLAGELARGRQLRLERVPGENGAPLGLELDMSAGWGVVADFLRGCR